MSGRKTDYFDVFRTLDTCVQELFIQRVRAVAIDKNYVLQKKSHNSEKKLFLHPPSCPVRFVFATESTILPLLLSNLVELFA